MIKDQTRTKGTTSNAAKPTETESNIKFELLDRDGLGRACRLYTPHGHLDTPTLLPVINPNDQVLTAGEMRKLFGTQGVITNSYIIYKSERLHENALQKGVHGLLDFDGPIMTDSGTFQLFMYGRVNVQPQEIIEFQKQIKPDIGTILDVFGPARQTYEEAQEIVKETLKRAKDAVDIKDGQAFAGTVQGSLYPDLREHCADELSKLPFEMHPIGGVVPVIEQYLFSDLVKVIIASKKGLDPSRPVHLFGAGHPLIFPLAVALGCDTFDSASYIKYAKDDRLLFPEGTKKLAQLELLPCLCPVCNDTTVPELRSMDGPERIKLLAKHNLYVCFNELVRVKEAILEGTLWELVEMRARAHPQLLHSLKELYSNWKYLEHFEPISRKRFLYVGPESMQRPEIKRFVNRIKDRYDRPKTKTIVMFQEPGNRTTSYEEHFYSEISDVQKITDAHFVCQTMFGPVPIEFDGMYPFGQSVVDPELARELASSPKVIDQMKTYSHKLTNEFTIIWDGEQTLENLKMLSSAKNMFDIAEARMRAVADYQFGPGAAEALFKGELKFVRSKNTGKIRNILLDGKHILSLSAGVSLFTMRVPGARLLHDAIPKPRLRVVVAPDSAEFNRKGKSVFSKFVLSCDAGLRPGDEVLITDEEDTLVAIGRMVLIDLEAEAFDMGIAVRVREGIK